MLNLTHQKQNKKENKIKTTTNKNLKLPNQANKKTKNKTKILESKEKKFHGFSEELRLWVAFDFHVTRFLFCFIFYSWDVS